MGQVFDTLYFNVAVIWGMTIFLYAALYFEWLKKMVHRLEMQRKYKSKDK
jgi:ABC transport system ATP-binding/permease protein